MMLFALGQVRSENRLARMAISQSDGQICLYGAEWLCCAFPASAAENSYCEQRSRFPGVTISHHNESNISCAASFN
jgi:hypothetical protein